MVRTRCGVHVSFACGEEHGALACVAEVSREEQVAFVRTNPTCIAVTEANSYIRFGLLALNSFAYDSVVFF